MVAQRILVFEPTGHPQIDAVVSVPEAVIAPAASGIAALRAEMQSPEVVSDGARLRDCYERLQSAEATVHELYERWAELESKQGRTVL